jgi:formylglycine-generating enzyme required for sulfatase activity
MNRIIAIIALFVALSGLTTAAPEKFDPFPRKQEILKLFADEFITVPADKKAAARTFIMGSPVAPDQRPPHEVTFKDEFALAKNETTQELYQVVMGENPSKWKGPRNAVELTTWHDASAFCSKVTDLLRAGKLIGAKDAIRLPTEAEWEFACRAGTSTGWSFGDDVADLTVYGWYNANSKGHDPPVGMKKANPWGLFDMHGNVWQWCWDWYGKSSSASQVDPKGPVSGSNRVLRGGSWNSPGKDLRSSCRFSSAPEGLGGKTSHGFRVVRSW